MQKKGTFIKMCTAVIQKYVRWKKAASIFFHDKISQHQTTELNNKDENVEQWLIWVAYGQGVKNIKGKVMKKIANKLIKIKDTKDENSKFPNSFLAALVMGSK